MKPAEERWMRKQTHVTTSEKTRDRASNRNDIPGFKPPASNQVQYEAVKLSPGGGEPAKRSARMSVSAAETPTSPTPIAATSRRDIARPKIPRTRKPRSGRTGMSQRRVAMSALHRPGGVGIERLEMAADLKDEGQAQRDLGRGHGQDEEKDDLSVRLAPSGPGRDEGQSGRVDHDLERHQDEQEI